MSPVDVAAVVNAMIKSALWLLLIAVVVASRGGGTADAFSVVPNGGGIGRSFVAAARRSSTTLSMNVENMPTKDIIRVGVIGMSVLQVANE